MISAWVLLLPMSISDSIWSNLLAPRSCHMHHGVPAPCHEKSSRDDALRKVCYDASYIGYAHSPQVFAPMLSKKKTHPNVFCLGFSQGVWKGKGDTKRMNNIEQRFFLVVQWSSRRVLRYGPWCWGMGLLKQNDLRSIHKHTEKQLHPRNLT